MQSDNLSLRIGREEWRFIYNKDRITHIRYSFTEQGELFSKEIDFRKAEEKFRTYGLPTNIKELERFINEFKAKKLDEAKLEDTLDHLAVYLFDVYVIVD